jgi:hypothetical protein
MHDVAQTVVSQYQNSPTLMQLVQNMDMYIDPSADLDAFYSFVWNVQTAQGFGLDIWGKIVGVNRNLNVTVTQANFGFKEGQDYYPFGQEPFYNGPQTGAYVLGDAAYRTLIMVKALANISAATIPSYNQLLKNLFAGRGSCFVSDLGNMQIQYVFSFYLTPYEIAILTQSNVLPRPSGVLAQGVQVYQPDTFGFKEATGYQTFGHGTFALKPAPIK